MTTEQNMLDALIQNQVYSYRASTKMVNDYKAMIGASEWKDYMS